MPALFIEAPPGIRPEAKRAMMKKLSDAIEEAYHIGGNADCSSRTPSRKRHDGRAYSIREPQNT